MSAACNDISMTVEIGTSELTASGSLGNQTLAPGASVAATVTLTYADNDHYVDGSMTVTFGTTTFEASTVTAQAPVQSQVDNLIPTDQELNDANPIGQGTYSFAGGSAEVTYTEQGAMGYVYIYTNSLGYMWLCNSETAAAISEYANTTIEPNKWYNASNGMPTTPYLGSSPISLSDFEAEDIESESYVTRVINSFN